MHGQRNLKTHILCLYHLRHRQISRQAPSNETRQNFVHISIFLLLPRVIACIIMKLLFVLTLIFVYCLHEHLPFHLYSYTVKTSAQNSTKQIRGFESTILHSRCVASKYYCLLGKQEWLCRYTSGHRKNVVMSPSSFYERRR